MLPDTLVTFFAEQQSLLWVLTVCLDLGITILLYRIFGKVGLYSVLILNAVLCNLGGPKLIDVFGLTTSLGVILYSSIYFATDLLGERYGRREANRAVLIGFAANLVVIIMMSISLLFVPTSDPGKTELANNAHDALGFLFGFTPRFVFGSMLAFLISQTHDVWFFHMLKTKFKGRHLWLRNTLSTLLSQAIDTTIYSLVVWWGIFDLSTAIELALAKYVFKFAIAIIDTPFIYWARRWDVDKKDWNEKDEHVATGL